MIDDTAKRLYFWEDNYVAKHQNHMQKLLTKQQCSDHIYHACQATSTKIPALRFKGVNAIPCKADFRKWEITLAEWGNSSLTVLHETAHLATFQDVLRGENGHGPAFARQAIEFYSTFIGINEEYLLETAFKCRVMVGPKKMDSPKKTLASPFDDEIF